MSVKEFFAIICVFVTLFLSCKSEAENNVTNKVKEPLFYSFENLDSSHYIIRNIHNPLDSIVFKHCANNQLGVRENNDSMIHIMCERVYSAYISIELRNGLLFIPRIRINDFMFCENTEDTLFYFSRRGALDMGNYAEADSIVCYRWLKDCEEFYQTNIRFSFNTNPMTISILDNGKITQELKMPLYLWSLNPEYKKRIILTLGKTPYDYNTSEMVDEIMYELIKTGSIWKLNKLKK